MTIAPGPPERSATRGRAPLLLRPQHGGHDHRGQQAIGERSGTRDPEVGGRHDHDAPQIRQYVHLVSTRSVHSVRRDTSSTDVKGLEPPQVPVVGVLPRIRMRRYRPTYPGLGDHLSALPAASIEIQLAELQQVATAELKPTAGHGGAERLGRPFERLDAERLEQYRLSKVRN